MSTTEISLLEQCSFIHIMQLSINNFIWLLMGNNVKPLLEVMTNKLRQNLLRIEYILPNLVHQEDVQDFLFMIRVTSDMWDKGKLGDFYFYY